MPPLSRRLPPFIVRIADLYGQVERLRREAGEEGYPPEAARVFDRVGGLIKAVREMCEAQRRSRGGRRR